MRDAVLITGAGGYVGRHVVRAIADLGYRAIAIVREAREGDMDPRAHIVEASVLDQDLDLGRIVPLDDIAALVHLAWQDGFVHDASSHMANLSAHYRFLTGAANTGIPRIAALGTMHEVGYWEGAITAATPTNPITLYGIAKDALRRSTMHAIGTHAEYVWLRAYYILGDDRRNRSIFSKLLEAADRGDRSFPFTTGTTLYDFIDVAELGRQIAVASTTPGVTGIVNTCTGAPESLASRVERFIAENALGLELQYGAFPDRAYDSPGIWGDAEEILALMAISRFGKGL